MTTPLLAYSLWISYSQEQKTKLVKLFGIPRTGEVVVHVGEMMNGNIGGAAKQDGHRPEDLGAITTERMQEIIGTEDVDFYHMFQHLIDNLDDLYYEQFPNEVPTVSEQTISAAPPAPVPETVPEFVPRDPEELLKKSSTSPEDSVAVETPKETPKSKTYAKTTKAKGTKAN